MKQKKVYTGHLKLSATFEPVRLDMKFGGVSMGVPANNQGDYNNTSTETFGLVAKDIALTSLEGMQVPEGLEVKAEDFLYVPFRLISATMVAAGSWRSTFFKASVLKQAAQMLKGKGVFTDHDDRPKNWLGFVAETKWQPQTIQNGVVIPAGINGLLAIDTKQERNKDVARGILAGSVYSNSVGIMFNFTASHEFADEWGFRSRIGTMHEDGTMIHMVATEIIDIYETSLVSLGADPYAKRIDEGGNLVHVDKGGVFNPTQNSADYITDNQFCAFHKEKTQKSFEIVWGLNKDVLYLSGKNEIQQKLYKMNEKITSALLAFFALSSLEELTEEKVAQFKADLDAKTLAIEASNKVTLSLNKGSNLEEIFSKHDLVEKGLFETTKTQVETLTTENASLTKLATIGKDYLQMQKDLAKKFYRLAKMDKASEAICELIDKADEKQLFALIKENGIVIGGEFSYSCTDCGSVNFNFQSSKQGEVTHEPTIIKVTTNEAIREELKKKQLFG